MKKILVYLAAALLPGVWVLIPKLEWGGACPSKSAKSSASVSLPNGSQPSPDSYAKAKKGGFVQTDRLRGDTRLFLEAVRSQTAKPEPQEAVRNAGTIRVLALPTSPEIRESLDGDYANRGFNLSLPARDQNFLARVSNSREQADKAASPPDTFLPSKHEEGMTNHLASQSFESFYAALFGFNNDRQNHPADPAAPGMAQRSGNITDRLQENPFTETINQIRNNPASATQASSNPSSATQAQNGASGSQPSGNSQPGASRSTGQPDQPASNSAPARKPVPQLTIPGGVKPFTIVGNMKHDGIGTAIPAFRLQENQFEIPGIGLANLKLSVIADPAIAMRSAIIDDFNGDGIADIALSSETDPFIMVWFGLPNADFVYIGGSIAPNGGKSLASADFNADGKTDLALLQGVDNQNVDILIGDGSGRFSYATTVRFARSMDMLNATDTNSGSNRDLLGTNLIDFRSLLLASSGDADLFKKTNFSFLNLPTTTLLSDLNWDGRLEELFLFQDQQQLSIVLNPTRPLVMRHIANLNLKYPVFLVIGDLLGMGATDLGIAPILKQLP